MAKRRIWTKAELEDLGGKNLLEIVKEHTGKDSDTVDGTTLDRVLRNESLQQHGLGHLLESRVIGAKSPLELTDAEVQDRVDEYGAKLVVAAHLDKAVRDVTAQDFERLDEMVLDAHADAAFGKPLDQLSALERMRLTSAVRNARADADRATSDAGDAVGDGSASGAGGIGDAAAGARDARTVVSDIRTGTGGSSTDVAGAASGTASGAGTTDTAGAGAGAVSGAGGTAGAGLGSRVPADATTPQTDSDDQTDSMATDGPATGPGTGSTAGSTTPTDRPPTTPQPPSEPAETSGSTDYGQGQSMPAYDDDGFVGSVAGPEDYNQAGNGTWYLMPGDPNTPPHFVNDTTGHVAVMSDGEWVNTTTGQPVDALNEHFGSSGGGTQTGTSTGATDSSTTSTSDTARAEGSDAATTSTDDGTSSSNDDDGDDDDSSGDTTTEATGSSDDTSTDDESSSPGGDAGTPNPEHVFVDPVARAAFQQTPVGRSDRRTTERGIEANAPGAGLTDPPEDSDGRGSGGGPVRFIGGAIDPVDGEGVSRATLSDIDEMALPNAGLIDPPDDAPIGGDSPSVGGAGPIIGGGLRGSTFDMQSRIGADVRGSALSADDGGDGDDDIPGSDELGAAFSGVSMLIGSDLHDAQAFDTPTHLAFDADDLALDLDADRLDDSFGD